MLLKVKEARLVMGLTQKEAAKRIGIAAQILTRIEAGRETPWPKLRKKLSEFYDIPDKELFWAEDQKMEFLNLLGSGKTAEEAAKILSGEE